MPESPVRLQRARTSPGKSRIPITLICGFLGAGKTTLLNSLLSQAAGRRFAVLVNDFGELNIDAHLVKKIEGQRVELANGCICCTIRDDLVAGVSQFVDEPNPPESILIETSGISDPFNVLHTFARSRLRERISIDNVVTVVDSLNVGDVRQHEYWKLFERQVQAAYMIVLNKTGSAVPEQLQSARTLIKELAPDAPVFESVDGEVPLPILMGDGAVRPAFRTEPQFDATPHPFVSLAYRSTQPLIRERFLEMLRSLDGAAFRAKGLIQFRHYPLATVFQMVGSKRSLVDGPHWGGLTPATELVFIGSAKTLDKARLLADLGACEAR
jgi:G3E family GTPase